MLTAFLSEYLTQCSAKHIIIYTEYEREGVQLESDFEVTQFFTHKMFM